MFNRRTNPAIMRISRLMLARSERPDPPVPATRSVREKYADVLEPAGGSRLQGPRAVRTSSLLGELLVLFRDDEAVKACRSHCANRRRRSRFGRWKTAGCAALSMARLFDVSGQCLVKRPRSEGLNKLCQGIKQRSYRGMRRGILWAYLGEGRTAGLRRSDGFVAG